MADRIIAVVSGKGGVGKTFVTSNLGYALAGFGEKVTLMDTDVTVSNLGLQLGMYSFKWTLKDVLEGDAKIEDALEEHDGVNILPSSLSLEDLPTNLGFTHRRLKKLLSKIPGTVLMDCPPGLSDHAVESVKTADEILVVTNPEITAVTDALKVVKFAKEEKKDIAGIVLNKMKGDKYDLSPLEIEIMAEAPVIAKIPFSDEVRKSIYMEKPIVLMDEYSEVSQRFIKLAADLLGVPYEIPRFLFLKRMLRWRR